MSRQSKLNRAMAELAKSSDTRETRRIRRIRWRSEGSNRSPWEPTLEFQRTKLLIDKRNEQVAELEPLQKEIHHLHKQGVLTGILP